MINTKSEYRNPKQIRNTKSEHLKLFSNLSHSNFEFVSDFVLQISSLIVIAFFALSSPASAENFEGLGPFSHRVQNPLYLQGVTLLPDRSQVLPMRTLEAEWANAYSNIYERINQSGFDYIADMELLRVGWRAHYGLGNGFEIGGEVPWFQTWGGFLDSFIQDYHNAFGFPNGGRQRVANDQFAFHVIQGGTTLYSFDSANWNLWDVRVFVMNQVMEER